MHTPQPSLLASGAPASDPAAALRFARCLAVALLTLLSISSIAGAADKSPSVRLTGIAQTDTRTLAFLEVEGARGIPGRICLAAGESIYECKLIAIDPKAAKAKVSLYDKTFELAMDSPVPTSEAPKLHFKDADAREVLRFYQELIGRTLLVSPSIPVAKISLTTEPTANLNASQAALETALRDSGIILTLRGAKFAFATPVSHVPRLAQISDPRPVAGEEEFPPGLMKFDEADTSQALDIYQELSGRTLLQSPQLPRAKLTFKTQTMLTRSEAVWFLEAELFLANIKLIPESTKFVYVLPATRGVAVPVIPSNPAADNLKASTKRFPPGTFKLTQASAQQVLPLYAELIGRQPLVEPSKSSPAARFTIRTQTELYPVEAIYAFDALAALNQLRFVLVGDKQVKLVPASNAAAGTN